MLVVVFNVAQQKLFQLFAGLMNTLRETLSGENAEETLA